MRFYDSCCQHVQPITFSFTYANLYLDTNLIRTQIVFIKVFHGIP